MVHVFSPGRGEQDVVVAEGEVAGPREGRVQVGGGVPGVLPGDDVDVVVSARLGPSLDAYRLADLLEDLRHGRPQRPVLLHAHQRLLGDLPHRLDVELVLQGRVDDPLNVPALDVRLRLRRPPSSAPD